MSLVYVLAGIYNFINKRRLELDFVDGNKLEEEIELTVRLTAITNNATINSRRNDIVEAM